MKETMLAAADITNLAWDSQIETKARQEQELNAFKVLYNAGLTDRIPRAADGKSLMDLLDEDICGYCGAVKKRGEWCNNARCDSQTRRTR